MRSNAVRNSLVQMDTPSFLTRRLRKLKNTHRQEIIKAPVSVNTLHLRLLSAPKHRLVFVTATLNRKKRSNGWPRDSLMPLCGICRFKDKCRMAQVYNKNDCWPLQVCPYLLHTGTAGGCGRVSRWDLSCSSPPDAPKRWKLRMSKCW